jgi:tetratricopeptide (TPR) repeat protein
LSQQIQKHPENWGLYQVLGEYYVYLARYDSGYNDDNAMQAHFKMAVEKLTTAQTHQPLDGDGLYALGMAYSMSQELLKSIDCFNQALALGNKKHEVYFSLAGSQSAAGEDVQAIENGQKAFELYPDDHDKEAAALGIATNYENMKDYDNAEKFMISARQTLPQSDVLSSWLLYAYLQDDKVKEAEALFEDEVVKNPLSLGNLQNLMSGFGEYPNRNDLLPFLKRLRKKYAVKNDVLAGLYFCEGSLDLMDKKTKAGESALKKSKSCAEKVKPAPQEFLDYFKPVDPKLFDKEQALLKQYFQVKP